MSFECELFTRLTCNRDVGGVRSTYPNLVSRPGFSDPLVGRVRLTRILVGYEIGMTITVTDTALYKSMSQFIQTAQRSTGGGFSLFGFRFGASQGTTSTRSTSSISLTETSSGGRIVIPPSAPGLTYMLGALGKVM